MFSFTFSNSSVFVVLFPPFLSPSLFLSSSSPSNSSCSSSSFLHYFISFSTHSPNSPPSLLIVQFILVFLNSFPVYFNGLCLLCLIASSTSTSTLSSSFFILPYSQTYRPKDRQTERQTDSGQIINISVRHVKDKQSSLWLNSDPSKSKSKLNPHLVSLIKPQSTSLFVADYYLHPPVNLSACVRKYRPTCAQNIYVCVFITLHCITLHGIHYIGPHYITSDASVRWCTKLVWCEQRSDILDVATIEAMGRQRP